MRSLISIDFPAPEMEPESAHVVSAVSVPWLQCGDCDAAPPRQHSPILRYSAQVLNSSVARTWKLEQNPSGQASRQASRASRLWKLEPNNVTKKGPFFGPQNVRKSRHTKMGLPSSRFQPQLLLVKSASA